MVIVLGSHHSEKSRVIKGLCCVFAYDNCLWKQGQCTHLKLPLLVTVQPRPQEPWKRGCHLMTNCGYVQQIKHDLFTYVGVLIQTIPSKVKKSDFNGSTINAVKQGILVAFIKMKKISIYRGSFSLILQLLG